MGLATCHDCGSRFDRDAMHLIKASTLSGRALICDPCHVAEVERLREFNLSIRKKRAEIEGACDR